MKDEDLNRERRIESDILVDNYSSGSQLSNWYNYLFETVNFPFEAIWENESKESIAVKVLDITEYELCQDAKDIMVEIINKGETLSIPLFEIDNVKADDKTSEAIIDLHYWLNSGNNFSDEEEDY